MFTFVLSMYILRENFSWYKVLGVCLCMTGNIATVFSDSSLSTQDSVFGDIVALLSAVMYGVYTTTVRKQIPDENRLSLTLFFGFLGLMSFLVLLPIVLFLHFSAIVSLADLTWEIFGLLILKGLFDDVISDYLWARAMILTTPTVATVGLSLTVPFAIISDMIFHQIYPSIVTISASILVIAGLTLISNCEQ